MAAAAGSARSHLQLSGGAFRRQRVTHGFTRASKRYKQHGKQDHPFKVALDTDGAIARAFDDVNLTPTAILVDKNGKLLRRIVGEPDFRALAALIEEEIEQ